DVRNAGPLGGQRPRVAIGILLHAIADRERAPSVAAIAAPDEVDRFKLEALHRLELAGDEVDEPLIGQSMHGAKRLEHADERGCETREPDGDERQREHEQEDLQPEARRLAVRRQRMEPEKARGADAEEREGNRTPEQAK